MDFMTYFRADFPEAMDRLYDEIADFLTRNGVECSAVTAGGSMAIKAGCTSGDAARELLIMPVSIRAASGEQAKAQYLERAGIRDILMKTFGQTPVSIAEDRWRSRGELCRARLLAHLGRFRGVFARNCEVMKIDRPAAEAFLRQNHSYGYSSCRYCYGLVEKASGDLVAAASFSNARRWTKGDKVIRSHEWVRYASMKGTRVIGGMGKVLKRFIEDVGPDDIMSYADLEWSEGTVYRQLGFVEDGAREPVLFRIDPVSWERTASDDGAVSSGQDTALWFMNDGSTKYRLKITGYQG